MELTHSFTVPGTAEETWARFQDIASLAECFPGAQVTSFTGDSFEGTVKVKLGPIALVYAGSGAFAAKDEAAHTLVVEAKGRDKRGNGTAGATVTVTMAAGPEAGDEAGREATEVSVHTDLSITGKPAQFGRGVMQDVSDKLLGQFVACLEQRSAPQPAVEPSSPAVEPSSPVVEPSSPVVEPPEPLGEGVSRPPDHGEAEEVSTRSAVDGLAARPADVVDGLAARPADVVDGLAARPADSPPPAGDALDLGATLLPVLVRGYWKQALATVAVVVMVVRLLRRLAH
jgi:carbon monoxide dehydrogenase subunit G